MSLAHYSVATIDSPEFLNLEPLDLNPLMSKCEIKVLYVGANRNGSVISKDVAEKMGKTLRGAPIVGYFKEEKEDFTDHGDKITLEDGEIHFECITKPYGFVAPDAEVWFKKFLEIGENGEQVEREYLMTSGYLWTEQFPEVQKIFDEDGRPQSMELDRDKVDRYWAVDPKSGIDFYIINDAIISKLCILGDNVEPCYEGAAITKPEISANFSLDSNIFAKSLFAMFRDLAFVMKKDQPQVKVYSQEKYSALEDRYNELNTKYSALDQDYQALVEFKNKVEDQQKDDLIAKFYMLSDEDKKDVLENKRQYSLDDIEAKLAVICYRKKVNFDLSSDSKNDDKQTEKNTVTIDFNDNTNDSTPDWIKAVEDVQKRI